MPDHQTPIPPVFFAHGAPTLAVRDTPASRFLKSFGKDMQQPRFILILSAHWETEGLKISAPGPLRTYHDFRGFPDELYEISYPASADASAVEEVISV
jgi:4,5-DOPA dioxygenase extradiol